MASALGSRQDNQKNTHKIIVDGGQNEVATRVDAPLVNDKLDLILSSLGMTNATPTIFNVPALVAGTEYSVALPANTRIFVLKSRKLCRVKFAYNSGDTAINYITIGLGGVFEDYNFYSSQTIYFQTDKNNMTIEVLAYS